MSTLRRLSIHTIVLVLLSFGVWTDTSYAKRFSRAELQKACSSIGGIFVVENSKAFTCMWPDIGFAYNCSASGRCVEVDLYIPYGQPGSTSDGPRGDKSDGKGKSKFAGDKNGWNGKYTTVIIRDKVGTRTITVKQGVPIEIGLMVLGPDGVKYHVWDPRLGKQLEALGVPAYANECRARGIR